MNFPFNAGRGCPRELGADVARATGLHKIGVNIVTRTTKGRLGNGVDNTS